MVRPVGITRGCILWYGVFIVTILIDRTSFKVSHGTGSLGYISTEGALTNLSDELCSRFLVTSKTEQALSLHHQGISIAEDSHVVRGRTIVCSTNNLILVQTIALLLISTWLVDRVYVQVVGQDTCARPVISLKVDGVFQIRVGDIGIALFRSMILWTTSPCVGQTTVGLVIGTNPLGNTTAAIVTCSG